MRKVEGNVTRFDRLGLEDGLSQGCVNCILQDSQGFLWIGTQDGLNKYDGYTFTVYRHDPTDPTSLNANVTYALLEDSQGGLWLGTDRGLVRFDKRSEVFAPYPLGQKDGPQLGPVWIRAMLEDSQDLLWTGTYGQGLYRLDRRTGRWTVYQHDPEDQQSLPSNHVVALLEDTHGTLWIGTHGGGLGRLDRETGQFAHYRHRRDDPHSLGGNSVNALCEDAQGKLWIGTQTAGLHALELAAREPQFVRYQREDGNPHSLSHNHVSALLEDTAGTLWVGTGRGLNELDRQTGRFRRHYSQESDPSSLSFDEVLSLAEDTQGLLWIGTRVGLNKFDRKSRAFGHFRRRQETRSPRRSRAVLAFLEDAQGFLWIGTYGGGLYRSTTDDTLAGFMKYGHREGDPHSLADMRALPDADRPYRVGENMVLALCEDAQGELWIGTTAGLHRLLPGDHPGLPPTFARYQHEADNPSSLSDNTVLALALDAKGDLWIATPGGLNKLNGADATQGFVRYLHDENDPHSLSHDGVRTIHTDSAGNVWIGTNGGLNRVAPEDGSKFVRYQHDDTDLHSLSHDWVNCIAEDAQGFLWLGTWGGLNCFDPRTGRCTAYRETDGLSNDVVYGVLVDDQGCLWLSTNRGINRFDPTTERFTHYDVHDGVQANEFADRAFYKDRLGRLYFGGINGFNVFHPDDIIENTHLPPVVLTNFLLANQPVPISESGPLKEQINFADQIELAPEDYVFAFEFSALNYRQPHKNRFAYRLEGFDRDWIYTGARDRKAVYTNVPPGTYTFRVKAANDDGLWNEAGVAIPVIVSQPWWHILFRSAFEGVVIHDGETILQANQAALELYGYEADELVGRSVFILIDPGMHDEVAERIAAGDETPYESKGVRKNGSVFLSEVRARAIPYQGRQVWVAASRDITERKWAEQALQTAHNELEQRVRARTAELNDAVERLQREVDRRQRAEAETRERLVVQQGLASISARLMQATAFEQAVVDVLAQTGALVGAERVFLVRFQTDGQTVYRIHEWCASGLTPLFDTAEAWSLAGASGWLGELRQQGWFYTEEASQVPRELKESIPLFGGDARGGYCAVPVYARQELIGFLGCHGLALTGQDLEERRRVLEVVVGILGSAWLRERVLETLDQRVAARTRELSTFFDLTSLAIDTQDLADMLVLVPRRILELGSCDAMCIHLLDAERTTLILAAQGNLPPGMRQQVEVIALESDFLHRFERLGEPLVLTVNTPADPLPDELYLDEFSSYLGVPFPSGWVSYYRTSPHGFSLEESSLLAALAEQVGVSVENHRLRQRIGDMAVLEERQRLARDLHDSVTQSLFILTLYARGARDAVQDGETARAIGFLSELERNAGQALREMRLLLYELRPAVLEQEGLIRSLERRFDTVERRAGTDARVIYRGQEDLQLPHTLEGEIYYVAMEALNNTLKHAQATEVTVGIEIRNSELWMEIADNGFGFDPQTVSHGLGLHDIQERVEGLGGRLQIASEPGAGTRIMVWLDLGAA